MTVALADTSIVLKWFHADGEDEVAEARAVLAAHRDSVLTVHLLDLGTYELANILLRSLEWPPDAVADQLDDLAVICGPPPTPAPAWHREAAALAHRHGLTFYDAGFAAAAQAIDAPLISADKQLLAAGLAESAAEFAGRIGLV